MLSSYSAFFFSSDFSALPALWGAFAGVIFVSVWGAELLLRKLPYCLMTEALPAEPALKEGAAAPVLAGKLLLAELDAAEAVPE